MRKNISDKDKTLKKICYAPNCYMVRALNLRNDQMLNIIEEMQEEIAVKDAIIEELKLQLANRNSTIFGTSSEKSKYRFKELGEKENSASKDDENYVKQNEKKRGAVLGHKGHGRVIPENLPSVTVIHELEGEERSCHKCGKTYRETKLREVSTEIDVQVKVIKKVNERIVYGKACDCEESVELIVAPKKPQIIPKSIFSNCAWIYFLVMKFLFQIPTNRQIEILSMNGYEPNPSTIIGGFKKLKIFLKALYEKLIETSCTESHWHADETRWLVFEDKPDKENHRWWLWTFVSQKAVVFVLDSSRSSKVPDEYFGPESKGVINVDRYASYNILEDRMKKALCWYHLRRDFIKAMEASKKLTNWAEQWVKSINEVEKINSTRIECKNDEVKFIETQRKLESKLKEIFEKCDAELKEQENLTKRQLTILKSLKRNWEGYELFASNLDIPMHNNIAENALRDAALGRKNFYGSHAEWSGHLAAYCMSIFQTVDKHNLNVFSYMEYYFDSCAKLDGVPEDLDRFLPWNITEEIIEKYDMRQKKRPRKKN